ncbi:uncharacterized protein LOC123198324 [Mangifera indica]|uniref:uncharacterized protein LOC123198324 n=1 Tax=Mangifera indica TaxID=29780 RepID=UPI001CFAE950|nr:uncharacterized protein LOC123198324 [Mangifera indica]
MSDGGLTVVDGTQLLRSLSLPIKLPESDAAAFTGAYVLDFADSKASSSLFGLSLPQNLKSSALKRAAVSDDEATFRSKELDGDRASEFATNYLTAIADELTEDPLVVSVLDGKTLKVFLDDEDDFAMLAENLFTDLDTEDKGKIFKSQISNALLHMGVELGVPPFSEFPLISGILNKHGAEGVEELGQAQFAQLLQNVLQDVADALAEKHIVVIRNIKIVNGSKIRMLLANKKRLTAAIDKILQEKKSTENEQLSIDEIRGFLEKNGKEYGLPPIEVNEAVALLYEAVFTDIGKNKTAVKMDDEFRNFVKDILQKFAEELEINPVYYDFEY